MKTCNYIRKQMTNIA